MMRGVLLAALAVSVSGSTGGGLTFPMELDEVRCFYEKVPEANSKVFAHVEVLDGGYDLSLVVSGPWKDYYYDVEPPKTDAGTTMFDNDLVSSRGEKKILFRSKERQDIYRFCLRNGGVMMKSVMVNIKSHDPTEMGIGPVKPMEPIKKTIIRLSESLHSIKEEQHYLRTRERIHRDTAESTFERIMFWSILACILLLAMGGGQLWYYYSLFGSQSSRGRGV